MTDEEKKEKYELKFTNRFKKHLKLVEKRNPRNIKKIHETVNLLQKGEPLPERFCDHELTGSAKKSLVINMSRQGLIYIPWIFILNKLLGVTGLVWTQPVADVLSTVMAVVLYKKS